MSVDAGRMSFLELDQMVTAEVLPGTEDRSAMLAPRSMTFAPTPPLRPSNLEHHGIRNAWGTELPSLHDLRARLDAEAPQKVDRLVPVRGVNLALDDRDNVALNWPVSGGSERWPMTSHAFAQLAGRSDVPNAAADWLAEKHPDLGVIAVNRQLERLTAKSPSAQLAIRGKANGIHFVRAVLSDRYVPLDSDAVIGALDDLFGEQSVEARLGYLCWNGDALRTVVVFPATMLDVGGDAGYYPAVIVRNNEVGGGSVEVQPGLLRDVCTNTVISGWKAGIEAVRQRHVGNIDVRRLKADIAGAVGESLKLTDDIMERLDQARVVPIPDVASVIALLSRKYHLTQPQGASWYAGYREESLATPAAEGTVFGVVQGLARAARGQRDDLRHDTEVLAGTLLGNRKQPEVAETWKIHVGRARDLEREEVHAYVGVGG